MRTPSSIYPSAFGLTPGARPIRRRPPRGLTPSWDGEFASTKAYGPTPFESLLERDHLTLLAADPRIAAYAVQPHRLTYWSSDQDGTVTKRTYTPDVVARTKGGQILVVDAKARFFAEGQKWRSLEPFIRRAYDQDHGATFLVFNEAEIRRQPRLSNCQLLLRYRPPPDDVRADMMIRDLLARNPKPPALGELCNLAVRDKGLTPARAYSAAMRAALAGLFSFDMSQPIGPSARLLGAVS